MDFKRIHVSVYLAKNLTVLLEKYYFYYVKPVEDNEVKEIIIAEGDVYININQKS